MKSAIISDKPIHEKANDNINVKAYGGYLVCESVFNDDVKRLIKNAPKLYEAGKLIEESFLEKCRDTIRNDTVEDLHKSITINAEAFEKLIYVLCEIEGDTDS